MTDGDERLRRLAVLRAVADHDGRALAALLADLDAADAERLLDASVSAVDTLARRCAPVTIDLDAGHEAARAVLARVQHRAVAEVLNERP